jgi:phenylacetate-CoA ligase
VLGSELYFRLPVPVQEWVIGARGYARRAFREGSKFRSALVDVERSQWLKEDELQAFQLAQLKRVVSHARAQVPYYRELVKALDLPPDFPRNLEEFSRFPILTKGDIRAAGERLLADDAPHFRTSARTSGTTGASMVAWRDLESINHENAFVWRHMQWAGMKPGDARVWMRGDKVVSPRQAAGPYWRRAVADNMLMMSSYHLSEKTVGAYVEALQSFDPVVLQAYPSSVLMLARYLLARGIQYRGTRLRSVVTSSETVSDEDRQTVKEAFGVPILDWYGCMERITAIANCEHGSYHVLSDYGYTELMDSGDGTSHVVGTGFWNRTMPLIRYNVGDSVLVPKQRMQCACGRHFPVVERVVGRTDDHLLLPSGRRVIMPTNMLDDIDSILEAQIVQERPDFLRVRIVQAPNQPAVDINAMIHSARRFVGDEMQVQVDMVNAIERTANGKLRMVVRKF